MTAQPNVCNWPLRWPDDPDALDAERYCDRPTRPDQANLCDEHAAELRRKMAESKDRIGREAAACGK